MMSDEFWTDEEKDSAAYKACVLGTTGVSFAIGMVGTGGNILGGIAAGSAGYLYARNLCKSRATLDYIKNKVSANKGPMTTGDFELLKKGVKELEPELGDKQVLALIEAASRDAYA